MRKYLACAAVTAFAGMAIASAADAAPIQTLDVKISPSKLPKKKFKSVRLFVDIKTGPNSAAAVNQDQPPNASKTVVDFPRNMRIDNTRSPSCNGTPAELQNTSTELAIKICGKKSMISVPGESKSSSNVLFDTNPLVADPSAVQSIPVVLTAFNGPKNTLYFHNRAESVNNTTLLVEKLKKSKSKKYGTRLITKIPPIAIGAPNDFRVTIKRGTIVKARCKSTRNPFRLRSTFIDGYEPPRFSSTTRTRCRRK